MSFALINTARAAINLKADHSKDRYYTEIFAEAVPAYLPMRTYPTAIAPKIRCNRTLFTERVMSLILLRKLSLQRGHAYLSDPADIDRVVDLKCAGWVDAEVGPFVKGVHPPQPPLFAIVRGLTPEGWKELERLNGHDSAPISNWDQLVSFTKRKLPHFKFGDGSTPLTKAD